MKNEESPEEPLSNDPEENLRMENELLRLRLKAELGAESHHVSNIDPGIENEFLKNVLAFEQNFVHSKPAKVYDLVGKPIFKKVAELCDEQVEKALAEILILLSEKNIEIFFGDKGDYDTRTMYCFITEELFDHETTFIPMPGMTTCFDYEEFHPNHKKDIRNRAIEFLSQWFKKSFSEQSWELANEFILPNGQILSKENVVTRINCIFDSYTVFKDANYKIFDVGFQLNDETGIGHAEGGVRYDAVLENGETAKFGGPFKLYMGYEGGWWSIFHIVFPGFAYF